MGEGDGRIFDMVTGVGFAGTELRKTAGDGVLTTFEAVLLGMGVGTLAFLAFAGGFAVAGTDAAAFTIGGNDGAFGVFEFAERSHYSLSPFSSGSALALGALAARAARICSSVFLPRSTITLS